MLGRGRKTFKLHWLKRNKTVPKKQSLNQKKNYSKPHTWSLSYDFRFSSRKTQSQQKLAKMITHFTVQSTQKASLFYEP